MPYFLPEFRRRLPVLVLVGLLLPPPVDPREDTRLDPLDFDLRDEDEDEEEPLLERLFPDAEAAASRARSTSSAIPAVGPMASAAILMHLAKTSRCLVQPPWREPEELVLLAMLGARVREEDGGCGGLAAGRYEALRRSLIASAASTTAIESPDTAARVRRTIRARRLVQRWYASKYASRLEPNSFASSYITRPACWLARPRLPSSLPSDEASIELFAGWEERTDS